MIAGQEHPAGPSAPPSWRDSLRDSFKTQTTAWLVGVVIALLSIFSGRITEDIKLGVNRADLTSKYYEELASDLSDYRFESELFVEALEHGWTEPDLFEPLANEYNSAITALRKKEWIYRSWMRRFWGEQQVEAFARCMDAARAFDRETHALNDDVTVGADKKISIDKKSAALLVERLKPALAKLLAASDELNEKLN